MSDAPLRRLQWAVRAALTLGVAASVTANILHALPNPISQAIAAWPPLALLITVELLSRIPVYRKTLGAARVAAATAIAAIAAWVSYHHMVVVAFIRSLLAGGLVDLGFRVMDMSATSRGGRAWPQLASV